MQEVHTLTRLGVPPTTTRLLWMFGFQRRGVRRCENETFLPKPGPLPQMSQTEATVHSIIGWLDQGSRRSLPEARPLREPTTMSVRPSMLPGVTTLREPLVRTLGAKTAKALENALGMHTVGDLLRHYPRRYYTRGELTDLSSLREGDHVTVLARIAHVSLHPMPHGGPNQRAEVIITDDRAKLVLTFFFR